MSIELQLLNRLSDGHFHSGECLAGQLGVSRTTVWKIIQSAKRQFSLDIQSVKGRGYRLPQPLEFLDAEKITGLLSTGLEAGTFKVDVLPVVDSTNRYLMAAASQGAPSGRVVFAEQQTAGRGRLGRNWVSPFGCNLYCSLLWRFNPATSALSGLGIVVAVALVKTLSRYVEGLAIKWPNDVLWHGRKLAGILLEMQGEANGPAAVVIGFGVNVRMPVATGQQINQAWTDLCQAGVSQISRNELAADIIEQLIDAIQSFERSGLREFITYWSEWDILRDQPVDIILANRTVSGVARGIDETGGLRVETDGEVKSYLAGEASLAKTQSI